MSATPEKMIYQDSQLNDWTAFDELIKNYARVKDFKFFKADSHKIKGSQIFKYKLIRCQRSGEFKTKSKDKPGMSRKQGCPFFVRGKLDEEINKVEVTKKCLLHNHHLGDIDMIPQAQHAGINNFLNIVVELPENGLAHEAPIEENVTVDDDSRKEAHSHVNKDEPKQEQDEEGKKQKEDHQQQEKDKEKEQKDKEEMQEEDDKQQVEEKEKEQKDKEEKQEDDDLQQEKGKEEEQEKEKKKQGKEKEQDQDEEGKKQGEDMQEKGREEEQEEEKKKQEIEKKQDRDGEEQKQEEDERKQEKEKNAKSKRDIALFTKHRCRATNEKASQEIFDSK